MAPAKLPMMVSIVFIVLSILAMSLFSLLLKKAISRSDLSDPEKADWMRRVGLTLRLWVMLTAVLGLTEYFKDFESFPPPLIFGILPPFLGLVWLSRSQFIGRLLPFLPILFVYFLQFFRVIVEIELHQLWKAELVPASMTFLGRNFDIVVGLTAPIVGWAVYKPKWLSIRWALVWNILGLLVLTNIVLTGMLSTPTRMRVFFEEVPNVAVGIFPFSWLPTVLVPLAYALHILAIRYYFWTKNSK